MKSSRALLFAIFTFVAPFAFAEGENTNSGNSTPPATTITEPGTLSKIGGTIAAFLMLPVTNKVTTWIAEYSFNIPLKYVASFEYLKDGRFAKHVNNNNIGGACVVVAAFVAGLKAYEVAYKNQQEDAGDDEDLFVGSNYEN